MNSPSQFLSHTLSFPLAISLSRLCHVRVCVYGCLAMGLGIAILVGMWPCTYVDVNECNVCSVFMFLIWDFGFSVSYCGGICYETLWFWFLSSRKHIMVFNFHNSHLSALILKDWIMITLFCKCLFHWRLWSSRFFASDLFSFIFIIGWIFLIMPFVYYNFGELVVWHQQYKFP